jgi:uncharacterized membrane protein YgcG
LADLMTFREKYLTTHRDEEEGGAGMPAPAPAPTARDTGQGNRDRDRGAREGKEGEEGQSRFNAAKYLYPSWRLASLLVTRELPESRCIVHFQTPWPKRKFGVKGAEVAAEYDQDVAFNALSQIVFFFLGSLLRFHTLAQDIFLQTVCNSGLGLLGMWFIRLFAISPALAVGVMALLVLLLGGLLRFVSGKNNAIAARLALVVSSRREPESDPQSPSPPRCEVDPRVDLPSPIRAPPEPVPPPTSHSAGAPLVEDSAPVGGSENENDDSKSGASEEESAAHRDPSDSDDGRSSNGDESHSDEVSSSSESRSNSSSRSRGSQSNSSRGSSASGGLQWESGGRSESC